MAEARKEMIYDEFELSDDTDEFRPSDIVKAIPEGVANKRGGVKKMLPRTKKSFIKWRKEGNLKSFHESNASSFAPDDVSA